MQRMVKLSDIKACTCRLPRKLPAVMSLSDSCQEGMVQFFSGSNFTVFTLLWKSNNTQSIIRMMRWGGLPSVRTVAISDGFMVCLQINRERNTERNRVTVN